MTTYHAQILADSRAPCGVRLTTMAATMPRIVLAELNTHRALSRCSASSRAISVERMLVRAVHDPYVPDEWECERRGMVAGEEIDQRELARDAWLRGRNRAVDTARELADLGAHKQIVNRVLEPYLWHTAIVSATDWGNFFALRCASDAHPAMRRTAEAMRDAMLASEPCDVPRGAWHLPLVSPDEDLQQPWAVSAARCARVSYGRHAESRPVDRDMGLHRRLVESRHLSPLEHVAMAMCAPHRIGNFRGWIQSRKTVAGEDGEGS